MMKFYCLVSLLLVSGSILHAQVQLPDLYVYNYTMAQRDPFISSDATSTLLTANQGTPGIVSGNFVKQYLVRIIQLIKDELYVGGVSIGDTPTRSIALINGVDFHMSDKIPLEIAAKEL